MAQENLLCDASHQDASTAPRIHSLMYHKLTLLLLPPFPYNYPSLRKLLLVHSGALIQLNAEAICNEPKWADARVGRRHLSMVQLQTLICTQKLAHTLRCTVPPPPWAPPTHSSPPSLQVIPGLLLQLGNGPPHPPNVMTQIQLQYSIWHGRAVQPTREPEAHGV
jgi:hypothetical protein